MESGSKYVSTVPVDILHPHVLNLQQAFGTDANSVTVKLLLSAQQYELWMNLGEEEQKDILRDGQIRAETLISSNSSRKVLICHSNLTNISQALPAIAQAIRSSNENDSILIFSFAFSNVLLGSKTWMNQHLIPQLHSVSSSSRLLLSSSLLPRSMERSVILETPVQESSKVLETFLNALLSRSRIISGINVVPYIPDAAYGVYGSPSLFGILHPNSTMVTPENPYGVTPIALTTAGGNSDPLRATQYYPYSGPSIPLNASSNQIITQKLSVPSNVLEAVLSQVPTKLQEISQSTNVHIDIEQGNSQSNVTLLTVTGTSESNQTALMTIYALLESQTRKK
ncbi:U1 snRNP-associated protein Usp108 [Schizosaccharomyces cryophilus OY26]|uniref:U1 snRNP-associated protein Usp108 n=1 Tax=Schizosaccharomyces cryophilus (strain OY26 / ATCC MYA-4695 / CBS 11777 / NBRC 106824 / NRRL Y48691) TaxID=653667 RepID=S9W0K6_SCHCR|nr:U1 snRNP-associated protein Usp108 [Schizosaccharomyces cryophilus OY26]EPY51949.1 U1 snRNP-associated protein Usp108 [Schizosaccharomyces cryophilus OY26]